MRPSEELDALLTGAISWQQCSASVRSWARLAVHQYALDVSSKPSQDARRDELSRVPLQLREKVEQEARRLFAMKSKTG